MAALGSACATRDLMSPEYSARGWYQSEVSGIRILTNARPELAKRSLRKLARFLLLARAVGKHELPNEPITLHLFDRSVQYQGFVGIRRGGHAVPGPAGFYIALGNDRPGVTTQILFHEIVHLLLRETREPIPAWYHEGYAEYLASAILRPGVATLGRTLPGRVETLRGIGAMELIDLFTVRSPSTLTSQRGELYYAEAWAFVHFALASVQADRREPQLHRFIELLGEGKNPGSVFAIAFGNTVSRVQRRYLLHRKQLSRGESVLYRHYVIPRIEEEIIFEPVSAVVVERDLAAHAMSLGRFGVAFQHYKSILKAEPDDPEAMLGRAIALASSGEFAAAEDAVEAIDQSLPEAVQARGMVALLRYHALEFSISENEGKRNERNQEIYAENAVETEERTKEQGRSAVDAQLLAAHQQLLAAVDLNPKCRPCWGGIALFHARHPNGDPARGLEAVDHAGPFVQQGTLRAELLLRLGRFQEARLLTERVIATSHDSRAARAARSLLTRIVRSRHEAETVGAGAPS